MAQKIPEYDGYLDLTDQRTREAFKQVTENSRTIIDKITSLENEIITIKQRLDALEPNSHAH
jgi:hypothetical protein